MDHPDGEPSTASQAIGLGSAFRDRAFSIAAAGVSGFNGRSVRRRDPDRSKRLLYADRVMSSNDASVELLSINEEHALKKMQRLFV